VCTFTFQGDTVPVIIDRLTGEARQAQIFVAVMGASNFTYVEATWTQTLGDWIGAHTRALAAIGGVPRLLVPDNAKVAVIKACLYEPQVNRTYAEMAAHYGTAVLPQIARNPLARYGAMGARSLAACCASPRHKVQDVDRPETECQKLSASEAPDPGRHHVGIPGDIISECLGDFIGIRTHAGLDRGHGRWRGHLHALVPAMGRCGKSSIMLCF
jgi:hypothetical protein